MFIKNKKSGQLLLEILVAIAAAAIVFTLGAQLVYVSLQSSRSAGEKNTALGLAEETFEAVRSAATEKWQNLFNLTKGTTNYFPQKSAGNLKWILTLGSEDITINNIVYTRSFTIQNVCRDTTAGARAITGITDTGGSTTTCATSGGSHDPSSQRVSVSISWPNAVSLSSNEYLTRWRNKVCPQINWDANATPGAPPATACLVTIYDSRSNITPGAGANLQLCPSTGC